MSVSTLSLSARSDERCATMVESSASSFMRLARSSFVSRRSCIDKIASACSCESPNADDVRSACASAVELAERIAPITSSSEPCACSMPSTMCSFASAFLSWNADRRLTHSTRKSRKLCSACLSVICCGIRPSPSTAIRLPAKLRCNSVRLYKWLSTISGSASRRTSNTMRSPSIDDSSRISAMPASFFSFTSDATFSSSPFFATV
mmetsp:Transcript_16676/g.35823  ORF Transcript_16676/g.35823 Transcript_16676/m.35823 type:complete len:206 (+) Transcript_16676:1438-2055(+)